MYLTARPRSHGGTKFKDFGSPEIFSGNFSSNQLGIVPKNG